ncbi:MAG: restriction endonuclease subunit S [Bryobacterales bacterium]|nr:restriction endonuclease subunit S [Bryobacterales bacterium]
MKAGWETSTLDKIASNLDSRRVPITKSDRVPGEYPYYGASGIVDYVEGYIFDEETLLVSEDGANLLARTTPIAFPAAGRYWVNNHAHILKFPNATIQRFVEFYLNSISLKEFITGAAQPKLNQQALNSIPIPNPPLPEQQRIVAILDEAFAAIATAKANAEKNLQNARAIHGTRLDTALNTLRDSVECYPLSAIVEFRNGMNYTKTSRGETVRIVGVSDFLDRFHADCDDLEEITIDGHLKESDFLRIGDLLVVRSNGNQALIGRSILIDRVVEKMTHSGFTIRLRPVTRTISSRYLLYALKSPIMRGEMAGGGTGTNIKSLSQSSLAELSVPVPSLDVQQKLTANLDALRTETLRLESLYRRKLAALDELKKSLLHRAFNGDL